MRFYVLLLLTLFHETFTRACGVVLVLIALDLKASPLTVGVLAASMSLFPMMLGVHTGRFADRFGARWLILAGMLVGTGGMLLPYFVHGLIAAFMAAVMVGFQASTCNVSLQNLAGLLSTPETRARNFANYSLVSSAGNLFGPLVAGFSLDHTSHALAPAMIALLNVIPLLILTLRRGSMRGGSRKPPPGQGASIFALMRQPGVGSVLASSSLQVSGNNIYQFYMPVYTHSIGLSASTIGVVLAMNSVAAFMVRLVLPRLVAKYTEEGTLAYAFYIGAAAFLLVPFFENAVMLGALSLLFGVGMGLSGPLITMLMFTRSADGRSGEGVGLKVSVNHFTKIVCPVAFGAIASAFGLFSIFWLNSIMLGAGGFVTQPKKQD